jgi:NADP-dependent alcohol dehydrogenase
MNNFDFYNPTRICFGKNRLIELSQLIPKQAKVLLLSGGQSAEKYGTLAEVKHALGERDYLCFNGIEPNPSYETLMQAVALVKQHNITFLLAVGGGSVIDGTKFVAAAAHYNGEPWEILQTMGANISTALPFGTVLTLPATGSEMNSGSVITKKAEQAKLFFAHPSVFPQFSILEPERTFSLPVQQIGNGVVDAFVHIIEQYLTYPVNAAVQDRFAEGLLLTLIEQGPLALQQPENYDVRANLMWVATMALNGLIGAGVPQDWATHMLGHELTALHGLDHAQTLAIVLPSLLAQQKQQKWQKLLQYAERVWQLTEGDDEQRIDRAIEHTRAFFQAMGVPTRLSDYQIYETDIAALIQQLERHGRTALGERQNIDLKLSRKILTACL